MEKVLVAGNLAIAEAAITAGLQFYAGYPITPQNEIPEYMASKLPDAGGVFIQAESELAAISMIYGASATGARVMTSSSSPGISLKQEGISFLATAELPSVIVNMQRGGPGLGNISGSQADYFQAVKGGGHGDYHMLVYAPLNVQELWDLTMLAFDKADQYRTPVMILGDGILGQMMEPMIKTPYTPNGDLPRKDWALTGASGRGQNIVKTLFLGEGELEAHCMKLQRKYHAMAQHDVMYQTYETEDAELVIVAFGIAARIALSAISRLRAEGRKVGLFRPITLFPFPTEAIIGTCQSGRKFLTVELNAGQMVQDVRLAVEGRCPVMLYARPGGTLVTQDDVYEKAIEAMGKVD